VVNDRRSDPASGAGAVRAVRVRLEVRGSATAPRFRLIEAGDRIEGASRPIVMPVVVALVPIAIARRRDERWAARLPAGVGARCGMGRSGFES